MGNFFPERKYRVLENSFLSATAKNSISLQAVTGPSSLVTSLSYSPKPSNLILLHSSGFQRHSILPLSLSSTPCTVEMSNPLLTTFLNGVHGAIDLDLAASRSLLSLPHTRWTYRASSQRPVTKPALQCSLAHINGFFALN